MSPGRLVLAAVVVLLALPAGSLAQGLGDIAARARRERERTKGKAGEVKSFTNADLPEREEGDEETGTSDDGRDERASREGPSSDDSRSSRERAEDLDRARIRVERLEAKVEELQQRLNPMSTTYVYGGTGGPVGGVQANEEAAIRRQLDATQAQLDSAREDLTTQEGRANAGGRPARQENTEVSPH